MTDPTPLPTPPVPRQIARYGWKPSPPDFRDLRYTPQTAPRQLPPSMDLRHLITMVLDQGNLGSCTAQAIAQLGMAEQKREGIPVFLLARRAVYFWERAMEGTTQIDAGAAIRDGLRVVNRIGMPPETIFPYDVARFAEKPPLAVQRAAAAHKVTQYMAVAQTLDAMRGCLADGHVFVTGISVYSSFESPEVLRTGDVPLPTTTEQALGGHAITIVGYDDATQQFRWLNSWGTGYGDQGFGTLPYNYLANSRLAGDSWACLVCG